MGTDPEPTKRHCGYRLGQAGARQGSAPMGLSQSLRQPHNSEVRRQESNETKKRFCGCGLVQAGARQGLSTGESGYQGQAQDGRVHTFVRAAILS
jgi:hypothetical protein